MESKFLQLEAAAELLQISTERLNQLREQGELRAYRDGASWKFRTDEIEKMAASGVPSESAEESGFDFELDDLSLGKDLDLEEEIDLSMGSSDDLSTDSGDTPPAAEAVEKSAAEEQAIDLDELELESDGPDSILMSEAELGDSASKSPSTIIGKVDLDAGSDLDLASEVGKSDGSGSGPYSDVRLAEDDDLELEPGETGEMPAVESPSVESAVASFEGLEELELDLEAESSRILAPEDVAAAQAASQAQQQAATPTESSDLQLEGDLGLEPISDLGLAGLSDLAGDAKSGISGSKVDLDAGGGAGSDPGLTGLSALELDGDDDDDDDFVLGDGSDLTLSSADSGINLSPADSGLSLDDASLELTGPSLGSELDFGSSIGEASGLLLDEPAGDFELTPHAEEVSADDDDSSQVIALDEFEEQNEANDLLGAGAMAPADAAAAGVAMGASSSFGAPVAVAQTETEFSVWQVVFLSLCLILLSLCGIMVIDVIRSMWSWEQPYQVNSSILDALSGFLFP